jgi:hypothetical protein
MIEYRFRVPSAAVFTLYSYSKALEYRFRVPTAGSLTFKASFSSTNREEKHCIRIPVAFRLYLVKIIQILTN